MKPAKILVVDDEPGMLRAIERVLAATHEVMVSGSSKDASALALQFKPDLAILDIRMPDPDGFELMARLKALQPNLDIILMTGSLEEQDEKLVRAIRGRAFYYLQKPFDRDVLKALVDRCLELRWHREENHRHVHRMETELADARRFQQGLLPDRDRTVRGLAISCRYTPCSELGGDLYDYVEHPGGHVALLIADVSGHGATAAMLTSIVKAAFHAAHPTGYDPLAVVQRVSHDIAVFSSDRFVTLLAAIVNPETGRLTYVNAGHPPGFLWSVDGGITRLESTGPLVSPAIPAVRWDRRDVPIAPGDQLLLFTDGVSDGLDRGDEAGDDRLSTMIGRHAEGGATLLDAILANIDGHDGRYQDDLTLMTVRIGPSDSPAKA